MACENYFPEIVAIQFEDKYTRMPASLFDPIPSRHFLLFPASVANISWIGGRTDRSTIATTKANLKENEGI